MATILPIKELKNTANISQMCAESCEPIYITKNGYGDYEYRYLRKEDAYESNLS